jgi:hypothetical protein
MPRCYELEVAPGDAPLLCTLLDPAVGETSTIDARRGRVALVVPDPRAPEAEAALRVVAAWIPLRVVRLGERDGVVTYLSRVPDGSHR